MLLKIPGRLKLEKDNGGDYNFVASNTVRSYYLTIL